LIEQYTWLVDNLTPKYGKGIAYRIALWFELCEDEYDNMDNIRVAEKGNLDEMAVFEEMREQGCCGSHEWSVIFGKREFLVGFNYGH
jgi:hypothetical protein